MPIFICVGLFPDCLFYFSGLSVYSDTDAVLFLTNPCSFAETLALRKSFLVSNSISTNHCNLSPFPPWVPVNTGLSLHTSLPLSCQVLWALSFYANVAAAFWPRGDSLSLTALTADFTSNLLSLSSTAESCKCHYHFCHHHQLKHQLLPFLHLLFRANEVAADAQNSGFICGMPKVISPCRSVHILKVSERPGEGSSYTPTLQGWGADISHKGWKRSPLPPPHMNFLSYSWCHSKSVIGKHICVWEPAVLKKEVVVDCVNLSFIVIRLFVWTVNQYLSPYNKYLVSSLLYEQDHSRITQRWIRQDPDLQEFTHNWRRGWEDRGDGRRERGTAMASQSKWEWMKTEKLQTAVGAQEKNHYWTSLEGKRLKIRLWRINWMAQEDNLAFIMAYMKLQRQKHILNQAIQNDCFVGQSSHIWTSVYDSI